MLNIGHRHPKVVEAVKAQLDKLMHTCQTVMPYEGYVKLAQKLSEVVPVKGHGKVMLANSGPNSLAGTYSGSPTACAAALALFDVIEEEDILGKSHPSQRALHSFRRASPTHALHIIQCDQKTYPPKLYAPFICSEGVLANH